MGFIPRGECSYCLLSSLCVLLEKFSEGLCEELGVVVLESVVVKLGCSAFCEDFSCQDGFWVFAQGADHLFDGFQLAGLGFGSDGEVCVLVDLEEFFSAEALDVVVGVGVGDVVHVKLDKVKR